jgi:hypothetical protein
MIDSAQLDLPRDEHGRVTGYAVGREAALRDWQARREERDEDARVKAALRSAGVRTRKAPTIVDWSQQPLGREPDCVIAERLGVHVATVCVARKRLGIPPLNPRRAWTSRENRRVRELYAATGFSRPPIEALAAELGRTPDAVYTRIVDLGCARTKPRSPRWPATIQDLVRSWGYARSRIEIAAERLGIVFARGRRRSYLVTEEQADAIKAELAKHPDGGRLRRVKATEWGKGGHPPACVLCGRSDRPRASHGRCTTCDRRVREKRPGK